MERVDTVGRVESLAEPLLRFEASTVSTVSMVSTVSIMPGSLNS